MADVTYKIVRHNDGWAYEVDGSYSETYATREEALQAAENAARSQKAPGDTSPISYQDADGKVRREVEPGGDRPSTHVEEPKE